MSYEEEKQDRKIDQLGAEIERLRADNAGLSKAVIDTQEERDLAQAEFRNINSGIETPWNCINATMGIRYRYTKLCGGVVQE